MKSKKNSQQLHILQQFDNWVKSKYPLWEEEQDELDYYDFVKFLEHLEELKEVFFQNLRNNERNHLGLGDIRMTSQMQDDFFELLFNPEVKNHFCIKAGMVIETKGGEIGYVIDEPDEYGEIIVFFESTCTSETLNIKDIVVQY